MVRLGQHSIIIATYGDEKYSILAQMRALPSAKRQQHVQVIHQHYTGLSLAAARNRTAEYATGEWLTFLDADDELAPGYIEAINDRIEDILYPESVLFNPAVQYVHENYSEEPKLLPPKDLRTGNYLVIGTTVHRDAFFEAEGFQEWPIYEDWALFLRLVEMGLGVVQVPEAVYRAWDSEDGRNSRLDEHGIGIIDDILAANDTWLAMRGR